MGNTQFKISDIANAETRTDFENRLQSVETTQREIRESVDEMKERLTHGNSELTQNFRPKTLAYLKCVHMGSLRRSLFHSQECDKAVIEMAELAMDAGNLLMDSRSLVKVEEKIRKLE